MPTVSWSELIVCFYGAGGAILFLLLATWLATRIKNKNKDKDNHED